MKVAICSDSHDNHLNIIDFLEKIKDQNIKTIIHCGDISFNEALNMFKDNFKGALFFCKGNTDPDYEDTENFKFFKEFGEIELKNKKIAFVHYPKEARILAESGKYDYVFHGHTHKPDKQQIGNTILACPGNVANLYYPPSFAILDLKTNSLELIRL